MKILWIISFITFYSLLHGKLTEEDEKPMNVIHEYSNTLEKEKGVVCSSYGFRWAGRDKIYDEKIHSIVLGYKIDANLKLEEARKLFYRIVDGLLDHLNKSEKIRPYLFHYPVSYRDLEFHLSFDYHSKGFLKVDEVNSIHINENQVIYFIVDKEVPDTSGPNDVFGNFFEKHRSITKRLPLPKD